MFDLSSINRTIMIISRKNRFSIILGSFIVTFLCILWEHLNGGVITHHLLAREDLPGISNWWGILTIPSLTWTSLYLIQKRKNKNQVNKVTIISRFLAAFIFGLTASLLWEFDLVEILQFYILLPLPIALVRPLHLPEYLLGFVLGMLFTFGGMLPILVGLVLTILCYAIHKLKGFLKLLFKGSENTTDSLN